MNSTVGPSFKAKFTEFCTCGSYEQCTGPSQKNADAQNATPATIQTHTKENSLPQWGKRLISYWARAYER